MVIVEKLCDMEDFKQNLRIIKLSDKENGKWTDFKTHQKPEENRIFKKRLNCVLTRE